MMKSLESSLLFEGGVHVERKKVKAKAMLMEKRKEKVKEKATEKGLEKQQERPGQRRLVREQVRGKEQSFEKREQFLLLGCWQERLFQFQKCFQIPFLQ